VNGWKEAAVISIAGLIAGSLWVAAVAITLRFVIKFW